ncbi:MAG: hypothetical protein US60_C0010G0027 [Microgenomates group bacterium GW2011_GWC1_37_8]|uniref:DUF86 domain-containing protein n=1 Tax=Candidatus Woesebacteria bacterium GW2011_GWB1_38_8 TaxID=1618570 RepID=A0A0G0L200_9BACT|nr:MAG: hypothetical protein US60_C0010G0027 [Microgenomates group bacterium GW2011_GWC1_37_8]KKQ85017.1 MAG: hypothetical protein UT08_C0011G0035 [Candidatus Woesebacteria bacterium GW2011_GWB1_38_8]
MPIDKEIIENHLDQLKDYIADIENMDFSEESLVKDRDIQHLLSHRMHIAVEVCIDIATHIASALELPGRNSAVDVILLLGKKGILTKEFSEKFQQAPKLRNLLIHGYDNIDYRMLYKDYKNDLADLKEFARQIKEYLEKN